MTITLRNTLTRLMLVIGFIAVFGCAPSKPSSPLGSVAKTNSLVTEARQSNGQTLLHIRQAATRPEELKAAEGSAEKTDGLLEDATASGAVAAKETQKLDRYASKVSERNLKLEKAWIGPKGKIALWTLGIFSTLAGLAYIYFTRFTPAAWATRLIAPFRPKK